MDAGEEQKGQTQPILPSRNKKYSSGMARNNEAESVSSDTNEDISMGRISV